MKRSIIALTLLTLSSGALAQTIVVAPEQETLIREYVSTHSVAEVEVPDLEISVGSTLPDTVELHTLDVPDVSYSYVVVDGQTVLVEPETREIVHVIQN